MKTRIKVITRGDDSKVYYPQYKKFLFWHNFTSNSVAVEYDNLMQAQSFICIKRELASKSEKKIQSTDYIQYP